MSDAGQEPKKPSLKIRTPVRLDQRLPGGKRQKSGVPWAIKGELFMNCSCEVFCPCVVSLGKHPPTQGHCHAWMGIRIDEGHYGNARMDAVNFAILADIPGRMGEGQWKVALYVDEAASYEAYHGIGQIMSGKAGGSTGLLSMLIGEVLGMERTSVIIEGEGPRRRIEVGKKIQGEIVAQQGSSSDKPVTVSNSRYWIGPEIIIAEGTRSRVRDYGRVWDFGGRSAEIVPIDWSGPDRK